MSDTDTPEVETDTSKVEPEDLFYGSSEANDEPEAKADEPTEEAITPEDEPEAEIEAESKEEVEDSEDVESDDQDEAEKFDDSEMFIDLEGEDVSIADIKKWKAEGMMQADYTRKRQKDADDRRSWETDKQTEINAAVSDKFESFNNSIDTMEALIKEADETIDWDDLRQYDSDEYLKQKELKDKRTKAVEGAKALRQQPTQMSDEQVKQEQAVLLETNPQWLDKEGKQTDVHKKDLEMLSVYLSKKGFTKQDHNRVVYARDWQILLDAARYTQSLEKVAKVKAKVKKIPIVTKPKKGSVKKANTVVEMFYGTSKN